MSRAFTHGSGKENLGAALLPAALLLLFSLVAVGWLQYRPLRDNAPMVAIFAPTTSAGDVMQAVARTGGRIVGKSPLSFALIVQSDDPAFADRLHEMGAWMLLDAGGRGLCGRPKSKT